ncbi:hypothetical protein QQF64_022179 [Cirrhinus molitorella]|uniref:Reverse transcriptase n=1 Tax=Cirrhinus molitorella TaxID=172907 RepID=A0ABR3LA33_9TELE
MLKLGVIEPSRSPWSSPIVMVPKPGGTLRFCSDFRRLNEVSEFDGYPMPRVDELLDRLGRARFISTLDLTRATGRYDYLKVLNQKLLSLPPVAIGSPGPFPSASMEPQPNFSGSWTSSCVPIRPTPLPT